jgi:hypothetical protein
VFGNDECHFGPADLTVLHETAIMTAQGSWLPLNKTASLMSNIN